MYASNALDPQSPQARVIFNLGIISTIIFVLIFIIVAGGIICAIEECRFFSTVAKFILDPERTVLLSSLPDDARHRFRRRWLAPAGRNADEFALV